jgi:hypothetical protein
MHSSTRLRHAVAPEVRAAHVLGGDHPLSVTLRRLHVGVAQSMVVTTLLAAGLVAVLEDVQGAVALVTAAGVVQGGLTCALLVLLDARRTHVLGLIAQGREDLPLPAVEHERGRLLEAGRRLQFARSLERLGEEAERIVRGVPPAARPLFTPRVVVAALPELRQTAALLRADRVSARGVAMALQLLTAPDSPLYGTDERRLRQELRRIAFQLDAAPGSGAATPADPGLA